MRRVLVPLDGSRLAEKILPDAARLAGNDGVLLLIRDAGNIRYDPATHQYSDRASNDEADQYLGMMVGKLREQGVHAEAHRLLIFSVANAIDDAARMFGADMIACTTHGPGLLGKLVRGSIAWRAVAHSTVPVLLRHSEDGSTEVEPSTEPASRKVMVPLDGSTFAEEALDLAEELAREWHATLVPVRVVRRVPLVTPPRIVSPQDSRDEELLDASRYLREVTERVAVEALARLMVGESVVDSLVDLAKSEHVTDVVVATHGRTGLARAVLGSVADGLVQHLHCPIILLPTMAMKDRQAVGQEKRSAQTSEFAASRPEDTSST